MENIKAFYEKWIMAVLEPLRHVINDFLFHFLIKINSYEKAALRARLISMTSSNSVVLSLKSFIFLLPFSHRSIKIHSSSYLYLIIYSPALSQVTLCRDLESSFVLFHRPDLAQLLSPEPILVLSIPFC